MKFIGIQAGHQNISQNIDPALRPGTGAPGEVQNNIRIRDRLGQILIAKGFQVQLDDANANSNSNTIDKDFDFYLALHCEADVHGRGGGFMTAPEPAYDDVNSESKRIIEAIKSEYFKNSGIEENESWITVAMTRYYMWRALSSKTPCGIVEMGVAQNAHDKVILADTERVATALARGICKAFDVPFDTANPTPPPVDNIYKGYDLTDRNKMKELIDVVTGKSKYEQFAETVQKALDAL